MKEGGIDDVHSIQTGIRTLIRGMVVLNLVSMDVIEVSPPYYHAEITALAGATLALEFLFVVATNKG